MKPMCGIYFKLALSFLWKEVQDIKKHMQKALNLISSLSTTKIILSYPKVDWPCQDFTQGSTREQPKA